MGSHWLGTSPRPLLARDIPIKTSYLRTRGGYEVDLILEINGKIFAIGVESGHANHGDAGNLENFRSYHKGVAGFFLVTMKGAPARKIGRVLIMDLANFLREIGL